eukprot:206236-Pelagomonas_calceolata.AAC.3
MECNKSGVCIPQCWHGGHGSDRKQDGCISGHWHKLAAGWMHSMPALCRCTWEALLSCLAFRTPAVRLLMHQL